MRRHDSRLVLADVRTPVYHQLPNTGQLDKLGRQNVFRSTERVAESTHETYDHARAWVNEKHN